MYFLLYFFGRFLYHEFMNIVTIPKKLAEKGDLVVLPRKEYEEFFAWKKMRTVKPTAGELRTVARGRRQIREGKYVEWTELKRELARRSHR